MTEKELELFNKLAEDRKDSARIFEKPSMEHAMDGVKDKYTDQAHFVYELIQNADDAGATYAKFILFKDKLIFVHNGNKLFTISDVATEKEDKKQGKLGNLNAITAVANSSKITESSIGKFGVGFKAVFQYTDTPEIYDPKIAFRIEKDIIPVLLSGDCEYRKSNETLFVFPFNNKKNTPEKAYEDINHKLNNLEYPTLFMNHLLNIYFECGDVSGHYEKKIVEKKKIEETVAEKLTFINGKDSSNNYMWLFSRKTNEGYRYSCGFFVNENDEVIKSTMPYAFCFFPTKKSTNLSFIINAPFLLTDSREGIKAGDSHNVRMIKLLARLSADCFLYLRDIGIEKGKMFIGDNFLDLIPYNEQKYRISDERADISFFPFFREIKRAFSTEELLPSSDGYVSAQNAYMPLNAHLVEIFDNSKLVSLAQDKLAKWVIPSIGYEPIYRTHDGRSDYLRDILVRNQWDDMKMLGLISADFIKNQNIEWIVRLYDYILEINNRRVDKVRSQPIFLNQKGLPIAAYDLDGNAILFIGDDDLMGYDTISSELMEYDSTKKLVSELGIKPPELKDRIYNKILKKEQLNPKADFKTFLKYYIELIEDGKDCNTFISKLEERKFILAESEDKTEIKKVCAPTELYFATEDMKYYFEGSGEIMFVSVEKYKEYLTKYEFKYFYEFLEKLGVEKHARVYEWTYEEEKAKSLFDYNFADSTRDKEWFDYRIDEDERVIQRICDNKDKKLSVLLWDQLITIFEQREETGTESILGLVYSYFYHTNRISKYDGISTQLVKQSQWIFDKNGVFKSPSKINLQELALDYNTSSQSVRKLLNFLGIKDAHPEYEKLPDSLRDKLEKYEFLADTGIFDLSPEKIKELMNNYKNNEETKTVTDVSNKTNEISSEDKVIDELRKRVKDKTNNVLEDDSDKEDSSDNDADIENDNDEITKSSVDYSKKIEKAKEKCETEISKLAKEEELIEIANNAIRYSYEWFSSLLQLEGLLADESTNSREVHICFSGVERERDNRILILKHPDKNIPQVMEELFDIPLDLTFNNGQTKRLIIERANVQSYTLRVIVKHDEFLFTADFSTVTQAKIVAQNPEFLNRELQKEFSRFEQEPYCFGKEYDMQKNLCKNIEFIFGPPGTGKTTYLANETILPLIESEKESKILVLTPTNKAADVLVTRIMHSMNDNSYEKWLVRYGVTGDEEIEKSPVFRSKELEIDDFKKCVIVTTMARFPYDYFIDSSGNFNHLHGINWDYIIVDEASMIPLVQMIYMLYLKTPKKFIIAGDPFQIEPTLAVSEWKDENIYKMVGLEDFSDDVETVPHKYEIKLLTKQYRSVASIGEVFSQLTYNGVLTHNRSNEDARPLNIEKFLDYENLNIINFPVSQYESIYRAKRLNRSSYHIYSALFVYEYATYIAKSLYKANKDETFSIGIIAPYSAQAGLIDKLIASANIPKNINVSSGTIHGFQGDECDIVIALFNPPPTISTSKEMFLNRQNIINVAISRAKDYLFVLIPDEDTEKVQNMWLINKLIRLIEKDFYNLKNAKDIEEILFDNRDYLENNAFSTGHQTVNVYGLPEKRYEIRSEDTTLDVQIHGSFDYIPLKKAEEEERVVAVSELAEMVKNQSIYHEEYGLGVVKDCSEKIIEISFDDGVHSFSFPRCLSGKLSLMDNALKKEAKKVILAMD